MYACHLLKLVFKNEQFSNQLVVFFKIILISSSNKKQFKLK